MSDWRNRIVEHGVKPANQFTGSPFNWRKHPQAQRDALKGVLDAVGWVTGVIENRQTGNLIDGHERVMNALGQGDETPVPYVLVDLSPDEEALILATLDPIGAMAVADKEALANLLHEVEIADASVNAMLAGLLGPQETFNLSGLEGGAGLDGTPTTMPDTFPLAIVLTADEFARWTETKQALGAKGDKATLLLLVEAANADD